jgi:pseudouridine-5'-monophosphatase
MNSSIINNNFSAIIFDMDGVLIDSEGLWPLVDQQFLQEYFPEFPLEKTRLFLGKGHLGVYHILSENGFSMPYEEFLNIRVNLSLSEVYSNAELTQGVRSFLEKNHERFSFAIGTSNIHRGADLILDRHKIRPYFTTIVTADDVNGKAKPAPDIFLLAAKNLGIDPKKCLVLEDAPSGIQAAKSAGMTVFAYSSETNQDQDLSGADEVFTSFSSLAL